MQAGSGCSGELPHFLMPGVADAVCRASVGQDRIKGRKCYDTVRQASQVNFILAGHAGRSSDDLPAGTASDYMFVYPPARLSEQRHVDSKAGAGKVHN
jgi:hypothetical protein